MFVPTKMFLTKGVGVHREELQSFELTSAIEAVAARAPPIGVQDPRFFVESHRSEGAAREQGHVPSSEQAVSALPPLAQDPPRPRPPRTATASTA